MHEGKPSFLGEKILLRFHSFETKRLEHEMRVYVHERLGLQHPGLGLMRKHVLRTYISQAANVAIAKERERAREDPVKWVRMECRNELDLDQPQSRDTNSFHAKGTHVAIGSNVGGLLVS